MERRRRGDVLLGSGVVLAIVALAAWTFSLDGPIRAPIPIATAIEELFEETDEADYPLGDIPCSGDVVGDLLLCGELIRLRTDLETDFSMRPLLGAHGPVYAGGPTSPGLGFLVYRLGDELRVTTSRKRARHVAPEASDVRLYFGYVSD